MLLLKHDKAGAPLADISSHQKQNYLFNSKVVSQAIFFCTFLAQLSHRDFCDKIGLSNIVRRFLWIQ